MTYECWNGLYDDPPRKEPILFAHEVDGRDCLGKQVEILTKKIGKLPTKDEIDIAITFMKKCKQSHIEWRDWIKNGGVGESHGSINFHEKDIKNYTQMIKILQSIRK